MANYKLWLYQNKYEGRSDLATIVKLPPTSDQSIYFGDVCYPN